MGTTDNKTYTDDQNKVLESENENLLISASAGSGKTTIMIEKIKQIIESKRANVSEILVVTFTKAAASEMKAKLIEKLENSTRSEYMFNQINDIATSSISTFDSFCAKLLKTYFYELGIDPAFSMLDEVESNAEKEKAMQKLIDDSFTTNDKDFFELLDIFSLNRDDDNLKRIIYKFDNFLNLQVDSEQWFDNVINDNYTENINDSISAKRINDYLIDKMSKFAKLAEDYYNEFKDNSEASDLSNFLMEIIARCYYFKSENNFERNVEVLHKLEALPRLPKFTDAVLFVKEDIKTLRDNYTKFIEEQKSYLSAETSIMKRKLDLTKDRLLKLYKLTIKFNEIYKELKKEKVVLDFSDLEHYVIKLLESEEVAKNIREQYKYIFIDEYQDTNYIQEAIISRIARDNNVFMVGDVKQSIYGFRASEPKIFVDKYNKYSAGLEQKSKAINLNDNFRSNQKVLEFANLVFAKAMTKEFGDIDYKNTSMLVKGGMPFPDSNFYPSVELNIIQNSNEENVEIGDLEPYSVLNHKNLENETLFSAEAEGQVVVETINKIKKGMIYLAKSDTYRPIDLRDIAILTASRGEYLRSILSVLDYNHIPYSSDIEEDVFDTPSMNILKNFLYVLDNRNQDIPMLSIMQSFLFCFDSDDLAELRKNSRECKYFYEAVLNADSNENLSPSLVQKIKSMLEIIDNFTFKSKYYPVDRLIREVIKINDFENYLISDQDGKKSYLNLQKLLTYLNGKNLNQNLSQFLDSINENPIIFANQTEDNGVKVTSIHKSKGLEYPIVILVGVGRDLTRQTKDNIVISKKYGVGIKYYDTRLRTKSNSIVELACKIEERRNSIEEKLRLLYVAITRAVNHLIIVGNEPKKLKVKSAEDAKSFYDWIFASIVSANAKCFEINYRDLNSFTKIEEDTKYQKFDFTKTNEKITLATDKVFKYEYPYQKFVDMPGKTTVSELIKNDDELEKVPSMFSESDNTTAIMKGVAYHKIMQRIDLTDLSKVTISEVLDNVVNNGELTSEQSQQIKIADIEKLLNNNQFVNMLANSKVYKEQEFLAITKLDGKQTTSNDSILIQGIVDLVIDKGDCLIVVDYKTNKWKNEKQYIEKYQKQLDIYAEAMSENFGKKVKSKYIYSFELGKFINL